MSTYERMFSDEELAEFCRGHIEMALEALERGDLAEARRWCEKHESTKHWIHDHYVYWVTSLLSHIQRKFGEDAAVEALKESYFLPMMGLEKARREQGVRAYMEAWVDNILRHHSMIPGLKIEEEEEKFVVTFGHCGSGGMLIDRGAYDGTFGFTRLTKPRPETWGATNVPIYCAHCAWVEIWSAMLGADRAPNIVIADRKTKPGQPCILHFYKDTKKVPEKYRERLGLSATYWHEQPEAPKGSR